MAVPEYTGSAAAAQREQVERLVGGFTVRDLATLFHKSEGTVKEQIAEVKPVGRRNSKFIYRLHEVAPYLCRPKNARQIADFMRTARPNDMPPSLTKEFWNGLRAMQAYMAAEGDLWSTDKVVALLGSVFNKLRMDLLLLPDRLERSNFLTDDQIGIIRTTIDETLKTLSAALVNQFNDDDGEFAVEPGAYHDKRELERIFRDITAPSEGDEERPVEAVEILGYGSADEEDPFEGL